MGRGRVPNGLENTGHWVPGSEGLVSQPGHVVFALAPACLWDLAGHSPPLLGPQPASPPGRAEELSEDSGTSHCLPTPLSDVPFVCSLTRHLQTELRNWALSLQPSQGRLQRSLLPATLRCPAPPVPSRPPGSADPTVAPSAHGFFVPSPVPKFPSGRANAGAYGSRLALPQPRGPRGHVVTWLYG